MRNAADSISGYVWDEHSRRVRCLNGTSARSMGGAGFTQGERVIHAISYGCPMFQTIGARSVFVGAYVSFFVVEQCRSKVALPWTKLGINYGRTYSLLNQCILQATSSRTPRANYLFVSRT